MIFDWDDLISIEVDDSWWAGLLATPVLEHQPLGFEWAPFHVEFLGPG